jgi:hypothetical protein
VSSGAPVIGSLRRQAEMAKRALSTQERATIAIVHDGKPVEWTLARDQLDSPISCRGAHGGPACVQIGSVRKPGRPGTSADPCGTSSALRAQETLKKPGDAG